MKHHVHVHYQVNINFTADINTTWRKSRGEKNYFDNFKFVPELTNWLQFASALVCLRSSSDAKETTPT